jgi:16S rRNA (cytosine1402-N4)-methyltransferase
MATFRHESVLVEETLAWLAPRPGGIYVDGTLGGGGHAERLLEASAPDGRLIGFDQDPAALAAAQERLKRFGNRVTFVHANFSKMAQELTTLGISQVHGILLDLGVSSHQLDMAERGFSFQQDGPLDMRMDPTLPDTAADLVNTLHREELEEIIRDYGEERFARRIAGAIVEQRQQGDIQRTAELAQIIRRAIPRATWEERLDPATRTFQALRIAVNQELSSLEQFLGFFPTILAPNGRVAIISFHSLEDRLVKGAFRDLARSCTCPRSLPRCGCNGKSLVKVLTSRVVTAGEDELAKNPRSRSARLRAAERLGD